MSLERRTLSAERLKRARWRQTGVTRKSLISARCAQSAERRALARERGIVIRDDDTIVVTKDSTS